MNINYIGPDELIYNNDGEHKEFAIDDTPYKNRYKYRYVKVILIIDDYSFEIENELNLNEDFLIYGKKVNDFKKLDYESLYNLNIAATQQLYKLIQNLQETNNELMNRITELENKLISE